MKVSNMDSQIAPSNKTHEAFSPNRSRWIKDDLYITSAFMYDDQRRQHDVVDAAVIKFVTVIFWHT